MVKDAAAAVQADKELFFRNGRLRNLEPIIAKWQNNLIKNHDPRRRDTLYWYGERACVGLLAAAAWQCEGISLEQYDWTRLRPDSINEGAKAQVDLWLHYRHKAYILEAKESKLPFQRGCHAKCISSSLDKAEDEVRRILDAERYIPIACLFVVPRIRITKDSDTQKRKAVQKMRDSLEAIRAGNIGNINFDLLAAVIFKKPVTEKHGDGLHAFPGIMMFLREVR
jgi:hypothetical protein